MKRTYALALALILVVFAVVMTSCVMATNSDTDSTSASSATLEPTEEDVTPVTTIVDSTTIEVEPLEVPATMADSTGLTTPTTPWPYTPIVVGAAIFAAVALVALALRRRGHKFSRSRLLTSAVLISLLTMTATATSVQGEEELTRSRWDFSGLGVYISGDSIDSAGNLWLGDLYVHRILRLNPSTNETKIWLVPDVGSTTPTVSVDNADNVWFLDPVKNRIGRLDPSTNFFTIWPIPTPGSNPRFISFDSVDNVYFLEISANKIGRLNPNTNEITEWIIPTPNSSPKNILVDSTGSIWFVEYLGNKTAKLNPGTNEITEWPIPTSDSKPFGLYVAKGLVYFTEETGRKIGRLNPNTNQVTEWSLSITHYNSPRDIFVDSKGDVWFIAYGVVGGRSRGALCRLGSDNILTYWTGLLTEYRGFAVDTKANLGDIYTGSFFPGGFWVGPSLGPYIDRFHSAAVIT